MKITFVHPHIELAGGVRVIGELSKALASRGHDVLNVSLPERVVPLRGRIKRLMEIPGRHRASKPALSHLDLLNLKHRVIGRHRPIVESDVPDADAVIATWWETAEWVARLSPRKGMKAYFIQQYEVNFGMPRERVDATWTLPVRLIVCSRWLADLGAQRFGRHDIEVVENGVDPDLFNAAVRGKQPVPTVGFLHSNVQAKRLDLVLKVIERARLAVPNLRCIAFGADPATTGLPLPRNTTYLRRPPQTLLRSLYASCDLWLCCSDSEGFHLPPHEAMACRCPVVSTRVGGPMDLIENGVEGFLAETQDVEELAARVVQIATSSETRWKALSDAAYLKARSRSWATAAALFEAAMSSVPDQIETAQREALDFRIAPTPHHSIC